MTTISTTGPAMPPADPEIAVIADVARVNAARFPDEDAVVDGTRRLTWRQLHERVTRLANGLRHGLGLHAGDRISVIAENSLEYYELYHGTAAARVIDVPLNQRLALSELGSIVERVNPRVIFHDEPHREAAEALAATVGATLVAIGTSDTAGLTYDSLLADSSTGRLDDHPIPSDPATICFTGGTTGQPKGCVITHGALIENGRVMPVVQGLRSRDRHLFVRPMAVAPGHRMISWHGCSGGTTVITRKFDAGDFYRHVEAERINTCLLSPTMFQMLLDAGNPSGHDVTSLRSVAYGGAPITPDLLAQVVEAFGCELHQSYGGSEAAIATHLTPQDHLDGRLASIGRPAPGATVRVVQPDGSECGAGEPGEILVRSGQVFAGYWEDQPATDDTLRDGFYWSGDLGMWSDDGYLSIVGRNKDLIISGGFNVYPIEVENALTLHPAVREAAVIGVPHQRWGESVHAVVMLHDGAQVTVDELVEFCRQHIASYKKPQSIEFVDELPRTTVGKVAKNVLRERAMSRRG